MRLCPLAQKRTNDRASDRLLCGNLPICGTSTRTLQCGATPTECLTMSKVSNWPFFGNDLTNASNQSDTIFNSKNIKKLQVNSQTYLPPNAIDEDPSNQITNFTGITSDDDFIYVTYETTSSGGWLAKISKSTNQIVWQFSIQSYTGVTNDISRTAPALFGDYLYITTNLFGPQTLGPNNNVTGLYTQPFPIFPPPRQQPPSVLAIRKSDGSLVWNTFIGQPATELNDPDNWISLTASPVVFDYKPANSTSTIPVVAVGSSSSQSFLPWFYAYTANNLAAPNNNQNYYLGDAFFFEMTDCGKFVLMNAQTGTILSDEPACPGKPDIGTIVVGNPEFFADGQVEAITRTPVNNNDATFGFGTLFQTRQVEFNTIKNNYVSAIGTPNEIRYNLLLGQQRPGPLAGLSTYNQTGVLAPIPDPINADFAQTSITIVANFNPGLTTFEVNGTDYNTQSPVDLPDGSVVLKFWPAGGVGGSTDIAINTEVDAYQWSYFGASTWGNAPSVNQDTNGNAAEVYFSTGQNHFITLSEQEWIYSHNNTLPYFERQNLLAAAQATQDPNNIAAAYTQEITYLQNELDVPLSGRGQRNLHNSIVGIDLRAGNFGQPMWSQRTSAYDLWNQGFTTSALKISGNLSDSPTTPQAGWTNIQEYYVALRGADGDYGAAAVLVKNANWTTAYPNDQDPATYRDNRCRISYPTDALVGFSKYGSAQVLRLSPILPDEPSTFQLQHFNLIGNSGTLGGANYGIAADKKAVYGIQLNTGPLDVTNAYPAPFPQNFIPNLNWYALDGRVIPFAQSFVSAYDFLTGKVLWETEIAERPDGELGFPISSAAAISASNLPTASNNFVLAQGGDGKLYAFRSSDGTILREVDLGNAGNAKAIILKKDIYILSGRFFETTFPNSDYGGTFYLYRLGLPYSVQC